jgi:FkbM family methyltransferase
MREESELVRDFFHESAGFFVEVGANHPRDGSQTWHLEQSGWKGILIEPQPDLAEQLRQERRAKVFSVACSSPQNAGQYGALHLAGRLSALDRDRMAPDIKSSTDLMVRLETLDAVLTQGGAPQPIDFLSIDVEGHEVEVLSGFDFSLWRPRLILLEDWVHDLSRHRFMVKSGYKLVRRTEINGWYVPRDTRLSVSLLERWKLLRKYYLGLPFRIAKETLRRARQPS